MTKQIRFPGLDATTPLGFLASLGLLTAACEKLGEEANIRLLFSDSAGINPVLAGLPYDGLPYAGAQEAVARAVAEDAKAWQNEPILSFTYPKIEKRGVKTFKGLKAPVAVFQSFVRTHEGNQRAIRYASCLMAEVPTLILEDDKQPTTAQCKELGIHLESGDNLDRITDRTFFDFTARNAQFIDQVDRIRDVACSIDAVFEALTAGTSNSAVQRSMDWAPMADAPGGIYSLHQTRYWPVTEWLAFRGFRFFPVFPNAKGARVPGCRGRRLAGTFTYPIWAVPATSSVIAALLTYPDLVGLSEQERRILGVSQVFQSELTKKADGRSGMFAPTKPV